MLKNYVENRLSKRTEMIVNLASHINFGALQLNGGIS